MAIPPLNPPSLTPDTPAPSPVPNDPGLPAPGASPSITTDQASGAFYTEGQNDGLYEWDMGILQVPVAGPGPQCEIIAVHPPIATRVFEWTVERTGQAPVAPSWVTNNANEVLLSKTIYMASATMGPDGILIWRRSGRYVYALYQAPGDQDQLFAGVPPWMSLPSNAQNAQPSDFDSNLSNASSTVPQGFGGMTGLN